MPSCRRRLSDRQSLAVPLEGFHRGAENARLLTASNFDARTFGSGQAFLDSLALARPDLVVLDLHMPGMNGLDVLAALADAGWSLPVIMITGHATPECEARCVAAGAVAYLGKPLDPAAFLRAACEAAAVMRRSANRSSE